MSTQSNETLKGSRSPVIDVAPLPDGPTPWPAVDPFLFCVHHLDNYPKGDENMAPVDSLAGREIGNDFSAKDGWSMYHGQSVPGFPQHPHRGFETITIARNGFIDHSDSMGAAARFGKGDVQWMTAGKGVVHSEMFPLINREKTNPAELFQIWLNLPKKSKMAEPYFSMYWSESIPRVKSTDENGKHTEVVVYAGKQPGANGVVPPPDSWAANDESELKILTIKMEANAVWNLEADGPNAHRVLYFFSGKSVKIADRDIQGRQAILLLSDAGVQIVNGDQPSELLLLQGRPIGEPVAKYGPFVMNTEEEIQAAFADYRSTQFGGWPYADDAPVHGREQGRFARHADGRIETPA